MKNRFDCHVDIDIEFDVAKTVRAIGWIVVAVVAVVFGVPLRPF